MLRRKEAHINIAPLVDVILVLLIIFMVTAPMIHSSIDIELPQIQGGGGKPVVEKFISITVASNGEIFLDKKRINMDNLVSEVKKTTHNNTNEVIQIKADQKLNYGIMFEILQNLVKNDYNKISLIAETK